MSSGSQRDRLESTQTERDPRRPRSSGTAFRQADRYIAVGFQIALALVLYILVGYWLDGLLDTEPWLTLLGAVLGFASMIFIVVRFANQQPRSRNRTASSDAPGNVQDNAPDDD